MSAFSVTAASWEILLIVPLILVSLAIVALIVFFIYRRAWRIPAPNEALIIVGRQKGAKGPIAPQQIEADVVEAINEGRTEGLDFRISTTATWVNPVTSRVSRLPLDSRSTDFTVDCHDSQKIACTVKGVILYKIGDNYPAMAAAARRFLSMDEEGLNESIRNLVTGQVRALVGGMTIPDLITDRQQLMDNIRTATHEDMAKLGLQIDSLTIQDISDPKGYIDNLGRPQAEAVAREASIAADQARQEKERAAKAADLEVARVTRDTEVEAAQYKAERDKAAAEAAQAGPLARAEAQRAVVSKETEVAELQVAMTEKRLDAEVRKAADAERYAAEQRAEAEKAAAIAQAEAQAEREAQMGSAEAGATKARGEADAQAIKARGLAEAEGIRAKAEALSANGDVVIDQELAERMPEIARAFAEPLGAVDNMIVLDGPEGLTKGVVGAVTAAGDAIDRIMTLPHVPPGPNGASANGGGSPDDGDDDGGGGAPAPGQPDPGGATISERTRRAIESARAAVADASSAGEPPAQAAATTASAEPIGEVPQVEDPPPPPAPEDLVEPVDYDLLVKQVRRLGRGDIEAVLNEVQTDEHLRDALDAVLRDEDLAADVLDRAQISGIRRKAAERLLGQLRQRA
jgi:uncharacterized membrane protein YqiK